MRRSTLTGRPPVPAPRGGGRCLPCGVPAVLLTVLYLLAVLVAAVAASAVIGEREP